MKMLLPLLYHLQHNRNQEDLPFWFDLAGQQTGPILELGCGTGRVLLPLLQRGFRIFGLDRDFEMLSFLRSIYPDSPVFQGDMTAFHVNEKFALILLPCNTLSTLSPPQRLAALRSAWKHLAENGLFAAALPNPASLVSLPAEAETEEEDFFFLPEGDPVQVSSAWERNTDYFRLSWYYDRLFSDGRVQRVKVDTLHTLAPVEQYLSEFQQADLQVISIYGDFDHTPYDKNSPFLLLVAKKM